MIEDEMTLIKFFSSYNDIIYYSLYAIGEGRKYDMRNVILTTQRLISKGYIDYVRDGSLSCKLTEKGLEMFNVIQDIEKNLNIKL